MAKRKKRLQMQRRPKLGVQLSPHFHALTEKYRAGTPGEIDIRVDGTDDQFEARIFHGWLNGREIPIEELCVLFGRDEATIRRWQAMRDDDEDQGQEVGVNS